MRKIEEIFIENLKYYRNKKGITQKKLSEQCEQHKMYVSDIESGRRLPSLTVLGKLAECLNIEPYMLLRGKTPLGDEIFLQYTDELMREIVRITEDFKKRY